MTYIYHSLSDPCLGPLNHSTYSSLPVTNNTILTTPLPLPSFRLLTLFYFSLLLLTTVTNNTLLSLRHSPPLAYQPSLFCSLPVTNNTLPFPLLLILPLAASSHLYASIIVLTLLFYCSSITFLSPSGVCFERGETLGR